MPISDLFDHSTELDVPVGPSGIAPDLLRDILKNRESIIARLLSGSCKTMESYAEAVGNLRAYNFVLSYSDRKRQDLERELGTPITEEEG